MVTKYQRYDKVALFYGAIGTTVLSFIYEFFKFGYGTYGLGMVAALFAVRFLSVVFFGVILVTQIMKIYQKIQDARVSVS
jgi:energy-coupling factor transport system substrate-specific component